MRHRNLVWKKYESFSILFRNVWASLPHAVGVKGRKHFHRQRENDRRIFLSRYWIQGLNKPFMCQYLKRVLALKPEGIWAAGRPGTWQWCPLPPWEPCCSSAPPRRRSPWPWPPWWPPPPPPWPSAAAGGAWHGYYLRYLTSKWLLILPHILDLHPVHMHSPGIGGLLLRKEFNGYKKLMCISDQTKNNILYFQKNNKRYDLDHDSQ